MPSQPKRIIIVGCGRTGAELARQMSRAGNKVVVIDKDVESLKRLGPEFRGQTLVGNGVSAANLIEAGIEQAGVLVSVTNRNCVNIAAALIAQKHFCVERVVARITDPRSVSLYESAGIHILCPTAVLAAEAERIIMAS
ncbi:MAG: TrkA family potassium uptake protein [Candidatus Eremiobacterota bacterium]